jgi:glycerol kinase
MSLTLAIDQGTHSTRAAVIDAHGRKLAISRAPVDLQSISPAEVEQSPEDILMSLEQAISDVLAQPSVDPAAIGQAGLATQRSSVLAWERSSGRALSPVLSWQDTRTRSQLADLESEAEGIRRHTGLRLSPHYGASKLRWLLQHNEAVQRARNSDDLVIGPLASFLLHHLSDSRQETVDHANASRTLLWNLRQRDWDPWLCGLFDVPPGLLPACRPICSDHGRAVIPGVPITAMNGDQNAALYAHGQPGEDTILVNIGTGAFVLLPTGNVPRHHPDLLTGISRSDATQGDYYLEGTVNGAGAAVQWAQARYDLTDWQSQLPGWLEDIKTPPVFLNTVGGLGAPWWHAGPAPGFPGCSDIAPPAPADALVAVIESIAFMVCANTGILHDLQPAACRIRISGGLSRLDGLCQRIASLSGLEVIRPVQLETTARGIAWLAAGGPDTWAPAGEAAHFEPQSDKPLRQRYHLFLEAIRDSIGSRPSP